MQYRAIRNQNDWCRDNVNITFPNWDAIRGPLHTNDDLLTCGSPDFGRHGEEDVIEIHGPAPDGYTRSTGSAARGTPDFYGPVRQPAEHLPVPTSNTALQAGAPTPATSSTGKTEITFNGTSNMAVTHVPATASRTDNDDAAARRTASSTSRRTARCTLDAPRQIDYNVDGEWRCAILTVRGTYPKSMTLGSEDDILIDGDLDGSRGDAGARPDRATRFVRVKHDVSGACGGNVRPRTMQQLHDRGRDPRAQATRSSSTTTSAAPRSATLTVDGAIAQKFRGPVGTFSGTHARTAATPRTTTTTTGCATAARRTSSIRSRPPGA